MVEARRRGSKRISKKRDFKKWGRDEKQEGGGRAEETNESTIGNW